MIDLRSDVTIAMEGLALCSYRDKKDRWEVSFPRVTKHYLKVTILKIDKSDETKTVLADYSDYGDFCKGKHIQIEVDDADWNNSPMYVGDNFSWESPSNDERDFRHFIDMEDSSLTHKSIKKIDDSPSVWLSLPMTTLYALKLTNRKYKIQATGVSNPDPPVELNRLGKVIGGQLKVNSGKVTFKVIGDESFTVPLENFKKYRYIIWFDNDCISKRDAEKLPGVLSGCGSDFHEYYNVVKPSDPSDKRIFKLTESGGDIFGRKDCDGARASKMEGFDLPD